MEPISRETFNSLPIASPSSLFQLSNQSLTELLPPGVISVDDTQPSAEDEDEELNTAGELLSQYIEESNRDSESETVAMPPADNLNGISTSTTPTDPENNASEATVVPQISHRDEDFDTIFSWQDEDDSDSDDDDTTPTEATPQETKNDEAESADSILPKKPLPFPGQKFFPPQVWDEDSEPTQTRPLIRYLADWPEFEAVDFDEWEYMRRIGIDVIDTTVSWQEHALLAKHAQHWRFRCKTSPLRRCWSFLEGYSS
jgi:hypothetical protein